MLSFAMAGPTRREQRLEAENRRLRAQLAALSDRLSDLQHANEGAYRELEMATGGARLDTEQPFGQESRKLGTLWLKGRTQ
jgi:hypothetical protein